MSADFWNLRDEFHAGFKLGVWCGVAMGVCGGALAMLALVAVAMEWAL